MFFRCQKVLILLLALLILTGCAGGRGSSPIEPANSGGSDSLPENGVSRGESASGPGRYLFGFWDCAFNADTGEFEVIPLRQGAFHLNIVDTLSIKPDCLEISVVYMNLETWEFHLDVMLHHPFPYSKFRGFDVRGIVFGGGDLLDSKDDPDLLWVSPDGFRLKNADGWTRWWNPMEFTTEGQFGYTPGNQGTPGFIGPATLNPYKYFANVLEPTDPVVPGVLNSKGEFAANSSAVRRYEMIFPLSSSGLPQMQFQYAVDASWKPPDGGNCPEPFYISVDASDSTAWYYCEGSSGGDLKLDIEVFDWRAADNPDGIDGEIEAIWIESDMFSSGPVKVPLESQPGTSEFSGIYHITVQNVLPIRPIQDVLVEVFTDGNKSYKPPAGGAAYPHEAKLAAYTIVDVSMIGSSLNITDVTPPDLNFAPEEICIVGEYLYAAAGGCGLQIFNISDPTNPEWVNRFDTPNRATGIDVSEGHAYVVSQNSIQIIDVDPPETAHIANVIGEGVMGAYDCVAVSGDCAYVGYHTDYVQAIHIFDISSPDSSFLLNAVIIPGDANGVEILGNYAYVAIGNMGIAIIEVDEPESALIVNIVNTPGNARDVAVLDGIAYVANGEKGLQIVDIDPPETAYIMNAVDTQGDATSVVVSGGYAFVADGDVGFHVIDIDPPISAYIVKSIGELSGAINVEVSGAYAYVSSGNLAVVDIGIPGSASVVNSIGLSYGWDAAVSDVYAYVLDYQGDLNIIDIDPPESANMVKKIYLQDNNIEVDVSEGYVYVVGPYSGLQIIDVDPLESANIVQTVGIPGFARHMAVSGGYAYVMDYNGALQIVDIDPPESAYICKTIPFSGTSYFIAASDDLGCAYVADWASYSLYIIDVDPIESAYVVNTISLTAGASALTASGDYVYVDGDSMQIIDVNPPELAHIV